MAQERREAQIGPHARRRRSSRQPTVAAPRRRCVRPNLSTSTSTSTATCTATSILPHSPSLAAILLASVARLRAGIRLWVAAVAGPGSARAPALRLSEGNPLLPHSRAAPTTPSHSYIPRSTARRAATGFTAAPEPRRFRRV